MYTTLRFSSRNTLYTVYTRFEFHFSIDIITSNTADNLFVTTRSTFCGINQFHSPVHTFAVALVHTENITGKNRSFIAATSATYFKDNVFAIVRIFWN